MESRRAERVARLQDPFAVLKALSPPLLQQQETQLRLDNSRRKVTVLVVYVLPPHLTLSLESDTHQK